MRVLRLKRLYFPALSILAAVVIMLLLIGISTYRNLNREEKTALIFLHQQGMAVLHALEAGARAEMKMPMWKEDSIAQLIQEIGKNEGIAYIYLVDSQGSVIHHSNPSFKGMSSAWQPQLDNDNQVEGRVHKLSGGLKIYDLAKRYAPTISSASHQGNMGMMGHGKRSFSHHTPAPSLFLA